MARFPLGLASFGWGRRVCFLVSFFGFTFEALATTVKPKLSSFECQSPLRPALDLKNYDSFRKNFSKYFDLSVYSSMHEAKRAASLLNYGNFYSANDPKFKAHVKSRVHRDFLKSAYEIAWGTDFRRLPVIAANKITGLKPYHPKNGQNHSGMYTGYLAGEKVLVKYDELSKKNVLSGNSNQVADAGSQIYEAMTGIVANHLGLGPKVFGIVEIKAGKLGTVMEFLPAVADLNDVLFGRDLERVTISTRHLHSVKDHALRMMAGGIDIGERQTEFQFVFLENGDLVIMDFASLRLESKSVSWTSSRNYIIQEVEDDLKKLGL